MVNFIQRRAAFDIGSGSIKLIVADVNVKTKTVEKTLFVDQVSVSFREHLAKTPEISLSLQNEAISAIQSLKEKTKNLSPQAFSAIATESLRLANNSSEVIAKLSSETGVPIEIVPQEEEGRLGFLTAVTNANIDIERAVSFDFGAGSFQVATQSKDQLVVYLGRLGIISVKMHLLEIQKKKHLSLSPNPISDEERKEAAAFIKKTIGTVPTELLQKITHPETVVLAIGMHPLWGMQEDLNYTREDLHHAIQARLDADDKALDLLPTFGNRKSPALHAVSNLILVSEVIETFGVTKVLYVGASPAGCATGVLISPEYWKYSASF